MALHDIQYYVQLIADPAGCPPILVTDCLLEWADILTPVLHISVVESAPTSKLLCKSLQQGQTYAGSGSIPYVHTV